MQIALNAVADGPWSASTRAGTKAQIGEHKKAIIKLKPLGHQRDSCLAALERAHGRRTIALKAIEDAQSALAAADSEIASLSEELSTLETQIAKGQEPEFQSSDCIEKMANSLKSVLAEMTSACTIPPQLLAETEAHMCNLLQGVRSIATTVQEEQKKSQLASGTSTNVKMPKRFQCDGASVPPSTRTRIIGKTDAALLPSYDPSSSLPQVPALPGSG